MKKSTKIILSIVLVLIVVIGFLFMSVTSSNTITAQLLYESGSVKVNGNLVSSDIELKSDDVIETANGYASVVLYESIIVSLDKNTKISLTDLTIEHPIVTQETGSTFNKFTKVVGVKEFSIKSTNSVASVRGTAFLFEDNKITTSEGTVDYVIDNQEFSVKKGKVVEKTNEGIIERFAKPEELSKANSFTKRSIKSFKDLRDKEVAKNPIIKKLYDEYVSDPAQIEEADKGLRDVDELLSKAKEKFPFDVEALEKVASITKEIQKMNKEINS